MYTRKQGEQQADIGADWIVDFSELEPWNMLTESGLGIIFALTQKQFDKETELYHCFFL